MSEGKRVEELVGKFSEYQQRHKDSGIERARFLMCLIYLLREEIECLRSVLSEYEKDHNQFVQWMRAEDLRRVIEGMEHKL